MNILQPTELSAPANRLSLMILLSFLAHLLLLSNMSLNPMPMLPAKTIKVALKDFPGLESKAIEKKTSQIVSPSPQSNLEKDSHYLSDYDSSTAKEQIKRGQLDTGSINTALKKQSDHRIINEPVQKTKAREQPHDKTTSPTRLFLDSLDMERTINPQQSHKEHQQKKTPQQINTTKVDQLRVSQFSKSLPFEKQSDKGLFTGPIGSPDYLPDIPDGDITLLNSKADQFAVFVRRVALQVFGAIKRKNWQELSASELRKLNSFSTIYAKMNKTGQLISVELRDSSGSIPFDGLVKESVEQSARDQNPPTAAAADDGNIHFIFKSRSWSRIQGDRRIEQRWILLGTGLL